MSIEFTDEEIFRLQAFRRVAARAHPLYVKYRGHKFRVRILAKGKPDEADLIPEFEKLAQCLRLIYLENEPAHFFSIYNLIYRRGDDSIRAAAVAIRRTWVEARDGTTRYSIHGHDYDGRRVLDTWMNAVAFHQDPKKEEDRKRLQKLDAVVSAELQLSVLRMLGCVLALDALVAKLLHETPLMSRSDADDLGFLFSDPRSRAP